VSDLALDDGTRGRSRAELADRVARQARLLREGLGLAPGDHTALLIGNRVEAVEGVLAALHAGVWMTPINWHLTEAEIAYVLRDSGARVLFTDPEHEATARAAAPEGIPVLVAGDSWSGRSRRRATSRCRSMARPAAT
jgi:acyl-CoA synthetase (AMP-forming)/AMP-acid ligase II